LEAFHNIENWYLVSYVLIANLMHKFYLFI